MEFWGISWDLPKSEFNRDLKRVTFVFAPANFFRESGENIEFMKVSDDVWYKHVK